MISSPILKTNHFIFKLTYYCVEVRKDVSFVSLVGMN